MRGFWSVMTVSAVVGLLGVWSLWDAAEQYTSTLRTYRELEVAYQPGSFVWLDVDYGRARLALVITNGSPVDATIQTLDVHLLFDGEFAGSNYGGFEPLPVPRGESRAIDIELTMTRPSLQPRGGTAELRLGGGIVARFEGIQRPFALDVRGTIDRAAT